MKEPAPYPTSATVHSDPIAELTAMAEALGLEPEDLDEVIHEAASDQASKVNNNGLKAQIEYLVDAFGLKDARAALEDRRRDPLRDLADLRGSMVDGYTDDQVNSAFGRINDAVGVTVVVVWDFYDGMVGGDSQFYIQDDDGQLYESAGDLSHWLTGDPDAPHTPATPGDPATWTGASAGFTTDDLSYSDDFHNYAHRSQS